MDYKETINNSAYLHSCKCPICGHQHWRSWNEEKFYCRYCGAYLYAPPFTTEEIDKAIFEIEMDHYED